MSDTIRIKATPNGGDNYLKLKLEQEFDFIEILSLKISQEDTYRKFCSDYGVVVGRVSLNNGFGVPNAMVSVFIPLDDVDKYNLEIKGLYPYEVITDKNDDGVRYNLLPKEGNISNECMTQIGTFPTKREILDNPLLGEVYEKYYKFTASTNHAGDFMLFGVPLGTYTIHVDADISDIGLVSQRPYDLISQGTPVSMFESPTKFKGDKNLNKLVQVKTLNAGVNIQPFWGDTENYEIGITRLDFDLNHTVIPSAIFVGSIFGDQDKHSINKNCQPNKKVGKLCEQITGSGSIEMIRKTYDGKIEQFDIDGSRLIDDDGTWAYQVPMNLDYVVTDELGNLSYSQDPNIGIPTRASVRFSIGIDENGGEGRLRTRAKYLVPNNPTNLNEIDYEFGNKTKDTSFRNFYWNKIYTVSNYVSRFQANNKKDNRGTTGIKDVDDCVGTKTPFPYNRVDTDFNPIFSIICLFVKVIETIIRLINASVIVIINGVIAGINAVIKIIRKVFKSVKYIDYVPCINIKCGDTIYVPGCSGHGNDAYSGQQIETSGLDECLLFQVAKVLNLFELDFYNDWVHGSLFSFLLKYKKNKNNEKFCDYNEDHSNYLLDSCFNDEDTVKNISLNEGLINKVEEEYYYAATTHDGSRKIFATDIANLGSILECDWQGIPKINQYLRPTSYQIPPDSVEKDENGRVTACGMVSLEQGEDSMFFTINCNGVSVNPKGTLNLRHICEMGVSLSETEYAPNGSLVTTSDCILGSNDIDSGKYFRDIFYGLNNNTTPWVGIDELTIPVSGFSTDFNLNNIGTYNFTSKLGVNGNDYIDFRGYDADNNSFGQTKNSFFFYFGLLQGKTAIDKLNSKFFTKCSVNLGDEIKINYTTTQDIDGTGVGSITFTFIGGSSVFNYTISGDNYQQTGSINPNSPITITNILNGTYIISGINATGNFISKIIVVSGPTQLFGFANTTNATTISSNDGKITILDVYGGIPPYNYTVYSYANPLNSGTILSGPALLNPPITISGLPYDITHGHTVKITDSIGSIFYISGLTINGNAVLTATSTKIDNICFDDDNGEISLLISGGQPPYSINTVGPDSYSSSMINMTFLSPGLYTSTITDDLGASVIVSTTINSTGIEIIGSITTALTPSGGTYTHTITASGGSGVITGTGDFITPSPTFTATVTDGVGCTKRLTN